MRSYTLAIFAGYVPAGIAYGALASAFHMPPAYILILSVIVYSGALQSAVLGFWAAGADPFTVILVGFLVNLRMALYGPHLQGVSGKWKRSDIWKLSGLLTDEMYAVGISEPGMSVNSFLLLALFSYGGWILGTAAGVGAVSLMPAYLLVPLALALPALFLGLMVPRVRDSASLITVAAAIALSVLGRLEHFPAEYTIVPILAGAFAGYFFLKLNGGDAGSTTSGPPS